MRLKDKVAIVTGGGSGIGRGVSLMFAEEGARVLVADLNEENGRETVDLIEAAGGEAQFINVDVTSAGDTARMAEAAVDAWGKLDILVNNAGIVRMGSVVEAAEEEWDAVLDTNLKGVFLCSKFAVPEMIRGGGGAIINLASVGGIVGPNDMAAYGSAKAGVINLTRQIAVDFGPQGVRVNCISPGTIVTDMHQAFYSEEEKDEVLAEWAAMKPLRKVGYPKDIAYAAVYLASDESGFVTGANLIVDGGSMATG